jgi:RNA polymerase sigma-70 factor, TIGR02943 family
VDEEQRIAALEHKTDATGSGSRGPVVDPERWVEKYGDQLFGFAAGRVRDPAIAQDLVQETFLAAIKAKEGFAGRSSERAWLFGILRNKVVDYYRLQHREVSFADLESPWPEEEGAFRASGIRQDAWVKSLAPKDWDTPEESLVNSEFHEVLKRCLSRLPEKVGQAFLLREMDGISSDETCKVLGISPNNLWVMLHRARMGLRRCLEVHWFGNERKDR